MKPVIKDNGFDEKGRVQKSLLIDGYEYFLIEERSRYASYIDSANFLNTGMALRGVKKIEEVK